MLMSNSDLHHADHRKEIWTLYAYTMPLKGRDERDVIPNR